jgi:hypothetical protein
VSVWLLVNSSFSGASENSQFVCGWLRIGIIAKLVEWLRCSKGKLFNSFHVPSEYLFGLLEIFCLFCFNLVPFFLSRLVCP